jgi:hypothetical protein
MAGDTDLDIDKTVEGFIDEVTGTEPEAPVQKTPEQEAAEARERAAAAAPKKPAPGAPLAAKPAGEPIPYPKSWKKDYEPHWAKFPREVQEYVSGTREKEYLDGLEQYKAGHQYAAAMREVVDPYMPVINQMGVDAPTAVKFLLNAHYQLSSADPETKHKLFAVLAKDYGIDLAKIPKPEGPAYATDTERLLAERLQKMETGFTSFTQQQVAERRSAIDRDVSLFVAAKDEAGNLLHPHFDDAADHIARLLRADPKLSLADAYDAAVWANPVTRAKEQARVAEAAAAKQREEAKVRAAAARKANAGNARGRPSEKEPTAALGSMDETLRETLRDIQTRQ